MHYTLQKSDWASFPRAPAIAMTAFPAEKLRQVAREVLAMYDAHETVAADTAHSIVLSSLRGIDSHGFNLLPKIIGRVNDDQLISQVRNAGLASDREGGGSKLRGCR